MTTLYRQYRPQTFAEIIGQEHITDTLQQALVSDRVAHAYLLHGPRGTGKTTTARVFAKRLLCTKPKRGEPCGACNLCTTTQAGSNIDIVEIDAASNRGIDDIRSLQEGINLKPTTGSHKIYIVDEVHMLTKEAFTALLKTLEEPVAHAVFILATTEFHKVPDTIASRCQVFRFRRATEEEMLTRLQSLLTQEKRKADDEALKFIAARSDGCFRDAESLLGQVLTASDKKITTTDIVTFLGLPGGELVDTFLTALVNGDAGAAIMSADEAFAHGFDPEQLLQEVVRTGREIAVALAKGEELTGVGALPATPAKMPTILRTLLQALQDLAYVPEPMVAVHLAILTLCSSTQSPSKKIETETVTKSAAAPKRAEPAPGPKPVTSSAKGPTIEQVQNIWSRLIDAVKGDNPVAATFLRAMQPRATGGNLITLEARYVLHRNYFEKPANRLIISKALAKLLGMEVRVRCDLSDSASNPARPKTVKERDKQEAELVAAGKDVFGPAQQSQIA